jgi:hypothetical protein
MYKYDVNSQGGQFFKLSNGIICRLKDGYLLPMNRDEYKINYDFYDFRLRLNDEPNVRQKREGDLIDYEYRIIEISKDIEFKDGEFHMKNLIYSKERLVKIETYEIENELGYEIDWEYLIESYQNNRKECE